MKAIETLTIDEIRKIVERIKEGEFKNFETIKRGLLTSYDLITYGRDKVNKLGWMLRKLANTKTPENSERILKHVIDNMDKNIWYIASVVESDDLMHFSKEEIESIFQTSNFSGDLFYSNCEIVKSSIFNMFDGEYLTKALLLCSDDDNYERIERIVSYIDARNDIPFLKKCIDINKCGNVLEVIEKSGKEEFKYFKNKVIETDIQECPELISKMYTILRCKNLIFNENSYYEDSYYDESSLDLLLSYDFEVEKANTYATDLEFALELMRDKYFRENLDVLDIIVKNISDSSRDLLDKLIDNKLRSSYGSDDVQKVIDSDEYIKNRNTILEELGVPYEGGIGSNINEQCVENSDVKETKVDYFPLLDMIENANSQEDFVDVLNMLNKKPDNKNGKKVFVKKVIRKK